jgi:diguanylate cyclase (GGDEF)-like protein
MDRARLTRLCGLAAALIGGTVVLGWVLREPLLIRMVGGHVGMVLSTAVSLLLAGLCLLLPKSPPWFIPLRLVCGGLLVLVGALALLENLLDIRLGIDWPALHDWLHDSNPRPGRMAPNTGIGILTIGLLLMSSRIADSPRILATRRALALILSVVGLTGLFGYFLKIELLYDLQSITRMALLTAIGLSFLGAGFWLELYRAPAFGTAPEEGREIMPIAVISLVIVAAIAGISVFSFMQNRIERMTAEHLLRLHSDRSQFFANVIEDTTNDITAIATRPNALARMRLLLASPGDAAAIKGLNDVARTFLPHGFTWIAFYQHGRLVVSAGAPQTDIPFSVPLSGPRVRQLFWRDGYHLRARVPMRDKDGVVGEIVAEQPLKALTKLAADTNHWGDTGEMVVCAREALGFRCFPERFHAQPFVVPHSVQDRPVPMAYAMSGKPNTVSAFDFRNQQVLAAHGPIGDLPLGMVLKMDWVELYAPVREQLQIILLLLAAIVTLSLLMMRRRLRPLVQQLIESKRIAQASEARFYAASENSPDGFYILDSVRDPNGIADFRYAYVNDSGARLISPLPRHRLLKQLVGEVTPLIRSGGYLDKYKTVVETGVPLREEFQTAALGVSASWLSQHVVRLGDGVAITMRDISETKNVEGRLRYMAQNDALTGLPNRALFNDRLEQAIKRSIRHHVKMALFYLDVDHFKKINDTFGHAAGDELLRSVSDRLRCCVRSTDTVARLGGDEFTVILEELHSTAVAPGIAAKIIDSFRTPIVLDENPVTVSIGITYYDGDSDDTFAPESMIEKADKALYQAKRQGRGRYTIYMPNPTQASDPDPARTDVT